MRHVADLYFSCVPNAKQIIINQTGKRKKHPHLYSISFKIYKNITSHDDELEIQWLQC